MSDYSEIKVSGEIANKMHKELLSMLDRYGKLTGGSEYSKQHLLALASYAVGQIIAMQDQRTMTQDLAMKIVTANITAGNTHVINDLASTSGTKQ